jgi:Concanavalin A-like lectin/glucanases superfamily
MGAYSAAVVADGASHYWRLGEPSGTTAADSIAGGANAPGTISGGVTLGQAGPLADGSTAMLFNGTTGKVQTAANIALVPPFTLEAWVKGAWAIDSGVVSNTAGGDGTGDFVMLAVRTGGQGRLYFEYSAGGNTSLESAGVFNNNQWHHLVGVCRASVSELFVDSVLDPNGASASLTGSTNKPIAIGTSIKYAQALAGAIAEVAIYPLALTPAQIANHYALRTATGGGGGAPAFPWLAALVLPD